MSHYDIIIEQVAVLLFFVWLIVLFGLVIHALRTATPPPTTNYEDAIEWDEAYTYDDALRDLIGYAELLGQRLYSNDVREREI